MRFIYYYYKANEINCFIVNFKCGLKKIFVNLYLFN